MSAPRTRTRDPEHYRRRREARRHSAALRTLSTVPAEIDLDVPEPVTEVVLRERGKAPKLPAEAFELARQVYYLQHGNFSDCARAIIAAGLGDSDDFDIVRERLQTWWQRERWPKRPIAQTIALRDAAADGGLYRGRTCVDVTTGKGAAPAGTPCNQSALEDSEFCPHHDPRPEYQEMRERTGRRLAEARAADFVPIEPFRRWLTDLRDRLVAEQEAAGKRAHHNSEGWHLVAEQLDLDVSQLGRWANGGRKRGKEITQIRAATVAEYSAKIDVPFEEVYGFPMPEVGAAYKCLGCGGRKTAASKLCRTCFEADNYSAQCAYVNGKGEQCPVTTRHESGYCCKCRRITERVPKPRAGRKPALTPRMLLFALDEYRAFPSLEWVATHLWATDAGGVRGAYKSRKSLTGSLAKRFRKLGLTDATAINAEYAILLVEHGPVEWPEPIEEPEDTAMLPFDPFRDWLEARVEEVGRRRGVFKLLSERTGLDPEKISRWIRRAGHAGDQEQVRRVTVESALERWGDGTTVADLYGGAS